MRRAEPSVLIPLRVGLAQPNLANLDAYLLDVSHPASSNFGKHWSAAQVAETFRPSSGAADAVHAWLLESGINPRRVGLSVGGHWVHADTTVEEAERLLGTEYYVYSGEDGGERLACADKYHLPEHVSKLVDIVTPTLHFDTSTGRGSAIHRRANAASVARHAGDSVPAVIFEVRISPLFWATYSLKFVEIGS